MAALRSSVIAQIQMPDPKTYRTHFENKHPKAPLPAVLKDAAPQA